MIPTLHREACLCDTVRYFLDVDNYSELEVIVIDQSTTHEAGTLAFIEENKGRYRHVAVKYQGLPRARNDGVRLATGDVVLSVDDDVLPATGFVAAHARAYADPEVVGVAGSVLTPGAVQRSRADIGDTLAGELLCQSATIFDVDFGFVAQWAPGGNMSFRRDAIAEIGWFDEGFGPVAIGEDAEFSHRARAKGRIWYEPTACLVHLAVSSGGTRDAPNLRAYMRHVGFSTKYFFYRVGAAPPDRCARVWTAFRKRVLNRTMLARRGTAAAGLGFRRGVVDAERYIRRRPPARPGAKQ